MSEEQPRQKMLLERDNVDTKNNVCA